MNKHELISNVLYDINSKIKAYKNCKDCSYYGKR